MSIIVMMVNMMFSPISKSVVEFMLVIKKV